MAESSGDPSVVNIASVNALVGNRNLTAYAATKAALVAMTRALAVELAPRIRVLAISPATVRTQVTDQLIQCGQLDPPAHFEKYLIKRFITVEEIAEMVIFLLGPAAASITGSNWVIDGGYTTQ